MPPTAEIAASCNSVEVCETQVALWKIYGTHFPIGYNLQSYSFKMKCKKAKEVYMHNGPSFWARRYLSTKLVFKEINIQTIFTGIFLYLTGSYAFTILDTSVFVLDFFQVVFKVKAKILKARFYPRL